MDGYTHRLYANSLGAYGTPRALLRSGAWLLERTIHGTPHRDAMGCYPLLCCDDWAALADDLEDIGRDLVTISAVADPFGSYDRDLLEQCFPDLVRPFKEHFVVDLSAPPQERVTGHHRRKLAKASKHVVVERCVEPTACLADWDALYRKLVERHRITGLRAFSRDAFAQQLRVPGIAAFRAISGGTAVAMTLWYVDGPVGYYHLGASSDAGYAVGASYALFAAAIDAFADSGLAWLDLGAGAGLAEDATDGLSRFKRGWSTGTRTAYLCGRVCDRERYAALAVGAQSRASYFPRYRAGEFAGARSEAA